MSESTKEDNKDDLNIQKDKNTDFKISESSSIEEFEKFFDFIHNLHDKSKGILGSLGRKEFGDDFLDKFSSFVDKTAELSINFGFLLEIKENDKKESGQIIKSNSKKELENKINSSKKEISKIYKEIKDDITKLVKLIEEQKKQK